MTSTLTPTLVDRSVTLTTNSAEMLPANNQRRGLFIQNVSAVNVGINIDGGTAAIGTKGTVTLVPNAVLSSEESGVCPKNAFTGICASATAGMTIWETV